MGEHAVVYGKPAILAAVDKRLYVTVQTQEPTSQEGKTGEKFVSMKHARKTDRYLNHVAGLVENTYKKKIPPCFLTISSSIPHGCGMGSSAAFASAVIGSLVTLLGIPWSAQKINEITYQAERFMHGDPSGGDNTTVCFGGLLWYRREFDFLKTFWSLPVKFPKSFAPFIGIHTGKPVESTKEMIRNVKAQISNAKRERIFNAVEIETKKFLQAVHDENESDMRKAIAVAENLLEQMGVVSESAQKLIRAIEDRGGVAKISGAGGDKDGSGIVLAQHDSVQVLQDCASAYGFDTFSLQLGQPGVRVEHMIQ